MAFELTLPFPIVPNANGEPLEDGYVYIGTSGLNPETSPISVYWDSAMAIPAAQPIRTINGFFSRDGIPGRIFASSGYSITVRNKIGGLVYSASSNTGYDATLRADLADATYGAGNGDSLVAHRITDLEAAAGITPTNPIYPAGNVLRYGATGDGVADDSAAIIAAITSTHDVELPKGYSFLFTSQATGNSGQRLYGGGTLVLTGAGITPVFNGDGLTGFRIEDVLFDVSTTPPAELISLDSSVDCAVVDCHFAGDHTLVDDTAYCIRADSATRLTVSGCHFKNMAVECIRAGSSKDSSYTDNFFTNIQRHNLSVGGFSNRCILIGSSTNFTVTGNVFKTIGTVDNGSGAHNVACIDIGNGINGTVSGNTGDLVYAGIDLEAGPAAEAAGAKNTVTGNSFRGLNGTGPVEPWGKGGIWVNFGTDNDNMLSIVGNTVSEFWAGIHVTSAFDVTITGNTSKGCGRYGIYCASTRRVVISDNVVADCSQETASTYSGIYLTQQTNFAGGVLSGNVVTGADHAYAYELTNTSTNPRERLLVSDNYAEDAGTSWTGDGFEERNNMMTGATTDTVSGASIDVRGADYWVTANGGTPATVTAITSNYGQRFVLLANDSDTTIDFSVAAITGNSGVPYAANSGDVFYGVRASASRAALSIVPV